MFLSSVTSDLHSDIVNSLLSNGPSSSSSFFQEPKPEPVQAGQKTSAAKPRAVLTSDDAIRIFRVSLPSDLSNNGGYHGTKRPSAVSVAREYNVSEKTVRDVWTGRTW